MKAHVKRDYLFKLARTNYEARVEFLRTQPPSENRCVRRDEGGRMKNVVGTVGGSWQSADQPLTKAAPVEEVSSRG